MWLRLYTNIVNDPKVQLLPGDTFKGWINILCLAKENDGLIPPAGDIAFALRIPEADATCLVEGLAKRGLLDQHEDGYRPHNWQQRQYESDSSSERVRRHRAGNDEQQKSGKIKYVYFIGASLEGTVKIGISKNPWARLIDIQSDSLECLSVLATFRADTYSEVAIHKLLDKYRQYGEWFVLPEHIQQAVLVAATGKQTYDQLMELLRGVLRSNLTELRREPTQGDYPTTTETEADTETEPEQSRDRGGAGGAPPASRGKPRSARSPVLPDEEWLDAMQKNPAYSMLNVRLLYQRMLVWCQEKNKVPSRRRLINWMNNEDKPMTAKASPPKKTGNAYVGKNERLPDGITQAMVDKFGDAPDSHMFVSTPPTDAQMSDFIDDLIEANDFAGIGEQYELIVNRGGAKAEWEIRAVAYYELHKNQPATPEQVAQINASIRTLARR